MPKKAKNKRGSLGIAPKASPLETVVPTDRNAELKARRRQLQEQRQTSKIITSLAPKDMRSMVPTEARKLARQATQDIEKQAQKKTDEKLRVVAVDVDGDGDVDKLVAVDDDGKAVVDVELHSENSEPRLDGANALHASKKPDIKSGFTATQTIAIGGGQFSFFNTLESIVLSTGFEVFLSLLVMANSVVLGITTDAREHGLADLTPFNVFDVICLIIFTLELSLRLYIFGVRLVVESFWAALDAFIVATGWLDIILFAAASAANLPNTMMLRVLRLFRLARAVRMMGQFRLLWSMARGLVVAMWALMWAFVLFSIILYMFAIAAVEIIGKSDQFTIAPDTDVPADKLLYEELGGDGHFIVYRTDDVSQSVELYFSSVGKAVLTCMQMSTFDSWASGIVRPIMMREWKAVFLFVPLMAVTALALMNLITAVLVERALEGAKEDRDLWLAMEQERIRGLMENIGKKLKDMDENGDGMIDMDEIEEAWKEPELPKGDEDDPGSPRAGVKLVTRQDMKAYQERMTLHLELKEALGDLDEFKTIFTLCDTKDEGSIPIDDLVQSVLVYKNDQNKFLLLSVLERLGSIGRNLTSRISTMQKSHRRPSAAPPPPAATLTTRPDSEERRLSRSVSENSTAVSAADVEHRLAAVERNQAEMKDSLAQILSLLNGQSKATEPTKSAPSAKKKAKAAPLKTKKSLANLEDDGAKGAPPSSAHPGAPQGAQESTALGGNVRQSVAPPPAALQIDTGAPPASPKAKKAGPASPASPKGKKKLLGGAVRKRAAQEALKEQAATKAPADKPAEKPTDKTEERSPEVESKATEPGTTSASAAPTA